MRNHTEAGGRVEVAVAGLVAATSAATFAATCAATFAEASFGASRRG